MAREKVSDQLRESSDMMSMVDVTFLLLIFFMVAASFTATQVMPLRAAIADVPVVHTVDDESPDTIHVTIDENNNIFVQNEDHDKEVLTRYELFATMRLFNSEKPVLGVQVRAHKNSKHACVVQVCDASRAAGLSEIEVASYSH